jgi:hypothetical protein
MDDTKGSIVKKAEEVSDQLHTLATQHRVRGRRWAWANSSLGLPVAAVAAAAGAVASISFPYHELVSTLASATVATLTALSSFLHPNEQAAGHDKTSVKLLAMADKFAELVMDIEVEPEVGASQRLKQLKQLLIERDEIIRNAPAIN